MKTQQFQSPAPGLRVASTLFLALVAAAVVELLREAWQVRAQIDDAYISYRYAQNLAEGFGLVFNPGEYVEGFTNLLWTLAIALGMKLGGDAEVVGHVLGVVSGCVVLVATATYASVALGGRCRWVAALAPWLVLAHPALLRWSESGMETSLFAACLVLALAFQAQGRSGWLTVSLAAATATRPEGAMFAGLIFGFDLLERGWRNRAAWRGPLAYAAVVVALTGFRLAYFGSPLPNTFFAKVSTASPYAFGARNAGSFLAGGVFLLFPPALLAVASDRRWWPGGAVIAAGFLYLIAIGGDTIGPTRFLLPVLPALAVLAVRGSLLAIERNTGAGLAMAGLASACVVWQVGWGRDVVERVRQTQEKLRTVASRQVDTMLEREPELVATAGIGYFGYASRLPLVDLLGLVDATVARTPLADDVPGLPGHQRSNAAYVLSRRPDYIYTGSREGHPLLQAHRDLLEHPDFHRLYVWDPPVLSYRLRLPPGPGGASR